MSEKLAQAIAAFAPALPLAVAYSGGADSTALLLACAEKWPGQVSAIHIHHGLQAAADDFEQHCRAYCAHLQVPLRVQKVDARPAPGQSPEDAARRARYGAFAALATDASSPERPISIALAQHADDQVETLLLALSRGAGLPGLSAMAAQWQRDGIAYHRPLLQVPGADLRVWLAQRGVGFVTDPAMRTSATRATAYVRACCPPGAGFPAIPGHFRPQCGARSAGARIVDASCAARLKHDGATATHRQAANADPRAPGQRPAAVAQGQLRCHP